MVLLLVTLIAIGAARAYLEQPGGAHEGAKAELRARLFSAGVPPRAEASPLRVGNSAPQPPSPARVDARPRLLLVAADNPESADATPFSSNLSGAAAALLAAGAGAATASTSVPGTQQHAAKELEVNEALPARRDAAALRHVLVSGARTAQQLGGQRAPRSPTGGGDMQQQQQPDPGAGGPSATAPPTEAFFAAATPSPLPQNSPTAAATHSPAALLRCCGMRTRANCATALTALACAAAASAALPLLMTPLPPQMWLGWHRPAAAAAPVRAAAVLVVVGAAAPTPAPPGPSPLLWAAERLWVLTADVLQPLAVPWPPSGAVPPPPLRQQLLLWVQRSSRRWEAWALLLVCFVPVVGRCLSPAAEQRRGMSVRKSTAGQRRTVPSPRVAFDRAGAVDLSGGGGSGGGMLSRPSPTPPEKVGSAWGLPMLWPGQQQRARVQPSTQTATQSPMQTAALTAALSAVPATAVLQQHAHHTNHHHHAAPAAATEHLHEPVVASAPRATAAPPIDALSSSHSRRAAREAARHAYIDAIAIEAGCHRDTLSGLPVAALLR